MRTSSLFVVAAVAVLACGAPKMAASELTRPEIFVDSVPTGAKVTDSGAPLGTTPLVLRATVKGGATHRLGFALDGFLAQETSVPDADIAHNAGQRLLVPLRPAGWDPQTKPIDADDVGQLIRAGRELSKAERCEHAIPFLQRAVEVAPNAAAGFKLMGACYAKLGKRAKALEAYKRFLLVAPQGPDADKVRAIVSQAEGDISMGSN